MKGMMFAFLAVYAFPLAVQATLYYRGDKPQNWRLADWSSMGGLPSALQYKPAIVRVYAARTGRWKSIFAHHCWIVIKDAGGQYERYDKVGWGEPIRLNMHAPDGRWYGNEPFIVFEAEGADAERLIPRMRQAIETYRFRRPGDYRVWPGPNSNTFVASVLAAVPEVQVALPPTAIGKDFPMNGHWAGRTPSGTGFHVTLGGYFGLTVGWVEGFEISILGGVVGFDLRRPAIKLPALGRLGLQAQTTLDGADEPSLIPAQEQPLQAAMTGGRGDGGRE